MQESLASPQTASAPIEPPVIKPEPPSEQITAQPPEPVKPIETLPLPEATQPAAPPAPPVAAAPLDLRCPVCGAKKSSNGNAFDRRGLIHHVRIKHEGYNWQEFASKLPQPSGNLPGSPEPAPAEPPPPDFSDVTGVPPVNPLTPPGAPPNLVPLPSAVVNYEASAKMLFGMSAGLLSQVLGPEWKPSSNDEETMMVGAIKTYLESVQLPDIPPGYMLLLCVAAYSAPRLTQPSTKSRLYAGWLWIKSKIPFRRKSNPALQVLKKVGTP